METQSTQLTRLLLYARWLVQKCADKSKVKVKLNGRIREDKYASFLRTSKICSSSISPSIFQDNTQYGRTITVSTNGTIEDQ